MRDTRILHEFPYRPNFRQGLFLVLLASGGVPLGGVFFFHPDLGGRLPDAVEKFVHYFFGALLFLSPIVAGTILASIIHPILYPRRVAFTGDSMNVPKPSRLGFSTQEIEVAFGKIVKVELRSMLNDWFLTVHHYEGVFTLCNIMFPSKLVARSFLACFTQGLAVAHPELSDQLSQLRQRTQSWVWPFSK